MKKILFVCSANKQRSKTADDYFSEKFTDFEFLSAGTNHKICKQLGTEPLTEELVEWADLILVMENKHRKRINAYTNKKYGSKIKVLGIPDKFKYYQKELIVLLDEKVIRIIRSSSN